MIRIVPVLILYCVGSLYADTLSPLFARGYTVLPQPQTVELGTSDFALSPEWKVELQGVRAQDIAVQTLEQELESRFRMKLSKSGRAGTIRLVIAPDSAKVGTAQDRNRQALAEQAYKMEMTRERITISANAAPGLFYGVISLVQMLKPQDGVLLYPEGRIEDWPDLELRNIYWDDAHHLERPEALRHAIRTAALFKINGFALKLEGHFQFKSAPAVVEPHALSPAEYQELTDYALKYHVQLIPFLDGPGHIAFILKHPEYASIREYPESNYELCVTNPDSYKLMFGMFQDLLDANKGGKYFYLSTDEPYYVGMANNSQCQEGARAKELGSVGKMLAEFITKTGNYLHDRGRTVLFWGEYPLKTNDVASLPNHLVNGEVYGPQFDPVFKKHGIREMIYTSSQGEERLFPQYFPLPAERRLHQGRPASRRVTDTFLKLSYDSSRRDADLMGMVNAGWADAGLHPDTFWLGYATSTAAGWHPASPEPAEVTATFYSLYFGRRVFNIDRLYQLMSTQAQFWTDSWETGTSKARKPIWGNSNQIFNPPHDVRDQSLPLPPVPGADLSYRADWAKDNAKRLELAAGFLLENDELLGLLHANIPLADRNAYTLEVFTSIAHLQRHNLEMLQRMSRINGLLRAASDAASKNQARQAVRSLDQVIQQARDIRYSRNKALADAIGTWYKTWMPRVAEANGRKFLHEVDDVKDHVPDRTVDMTYLVYRDLQLPFGEWVEQLRAVRNQYAQANGLRPRNDRFDWQDLKPVYGSLISEITLE